MERQRIILDTDIGDDIDDALALNYAARCGQLEVLGVTTVYKNTRKRARIASKLLSLLGRRDIPVYAGYSRPIINRVDEEETPCQYSDDMESCAFEDACAVDFIVDSLMESDGEITLVTVGPLTNIAMAFLRVPEVKKKVKELVMMAGAFYMHHNECNVACDPEASRVVFESGVKITAVGVDVTTKCVMSEADIREVSSNTDDVSVLLSQLLQRWRRMHGRDDLRPALHDPLAVHAVFDRDILELENQDVYIELKGEYTRGASYIRDYLWGPRPTSNIYVARNVDSKAFVKEFMEKSF